MNKPCARKDVYFHVFSFGSNLGSSFELPRTHMYIEQLLTALGVGTFLNQRDAIETVRQPRDPVAVPPPRCPVRSRSPRRTPCTTVKAVFLMAKGPSKDTAKIT